MQNAIHNLQCAKLALPNLHNKRWLPRIPVISELCSDINNLFANFKTFTIRKDYAETELKQSTTTTRQGWHGCYYNSILRAEACLLALGLLLHLGAMDVNGERHRQQ